MFSFRKLNKKLIAAQKNAPQDATFRSMLWLRFQKNRLAIWSLRFLYFLVFIALFANILANDKPLYCKTAEGTQFPVFREIGINFGVLKSDGKFLLTKWKNQTFESSIWPLIPYSSTATDFKNGKYKSPFDVQDVSSFRWRHHFGTDQVGRDVASGMIHGTRTALLVGLIAMAFHLLHGFQSAFQSLGLNHKKYTPFIQFLGKAYGIIIPLLCAILPLYFYFNK